MKNRFLIAFLLLIATIAISSCYSSRKQGCPMNAQANYKFKA
ncbi:MAG TPA: hypothetical protein PKC72_05685 [Chitinophagaceae bacterium]|nr:hypothetical protein [Chitinophagaceae bacterium]